MNEKVLLIILTINYKLEKGSSRIIIIRSTHGLEAEITKFALFYANKKNSEGIAPSNSAILGRT